MQISIVALELGVATRVLSKEVEAEIETYPVTVESKISKCSL